MTELRYSEKGFIRKYNILFWIICNFYLFILPETHWIVIHKLIKMIDIIKIKKNEF